MRLTASLIARLGFLSSGIVYVITKNPYFFIPVGVFGVIGVLATYFEKFKRLNKPDQDDKSDE